MTAGSLRLPGIAEHSIKIMRMLLKNVSRSSSEGKARFFLGMDKQILTFSADGKSHLETPEAVRVVEERLHKNATKSKVYR